MSRTLDVFLNRQRVGTLAQNNQGDIVFEYDGNYLNNPAARPLSQSLPLANEAALPVPMVRKRMEELADAVIAALPEVTQEGRFAAGVAGQIRNRCQRMIQRFKK